MEFKAWGKTTRLLSDVVITEKLDGSSMAIIIDSAETGFNIGAQSRNRLITVDDDHQGFAAWVAHNMYAIYDILGPGHHYGEYVTKGLKRPKFFLFNTERWSGVETDFGLDCVPIMYYGRYYEGLVAEQLKLLESFGSSVYDAPPEGVVIYWKADKTLKKAFCSGVSKQKGNI
jgi:hypothetical protein